MPDLHMTPETLAGHGKGCESLADKFGQLADLIQQARVDDQCFGPIGEAVGLLSGYYDTLDECRNQAKKAQDFLLGTKQSLDDTVRDYQDGDRRIAESLEAIGKELGA